MSNYDADHLYRLLPAVYRQRDAEQGYPLRDLVEILAGQATVLERDIFQLYENWFVETCEAWVVPYIGDLIGVRGTTAPLSRRAEVANTLGYRRAKGTAAVLERLARDVTGWPARVVEYFERLETTQYANHVRPAQPAHASLRDANAAGAARRTLRDRGPHRRGPPDRRRTGALQHPQHRPLPLAAPGLSPGTGHAPSGGRHRQELHLQRPRPGRAAVPCARRRDRRRARRRGGERPRPDPAPGAPREPPRATTAPASRSGTMVSLVPLSRGRRLRPDGLESPPAGREVGDRSGAGAALLPGGEGPGQGAGDLSLWVQRRPGGRPLRAGGLLHPRRRGGGLPGGGERRPGRFHLDPGRPERVERRWARR